MHLFIVGFILAAVIDYVIGRFDKASGVLRIDHSDPEKDTYRFEITDLGSLDKKKKIVLKIDHHADLSQK